MGIAILLGASSDNATIDVEKLIEFETQLASVCTFSSIIIVFCLGSLIDLESCRLHRHRMKDEILQSSINE